MVNHQKGIADEIYSDLSVEPSIFGLDSDAPSPLWLLMAGNPYKGECIDLANLMKLACRMVGIPNNEIEIGFVYGSSDSSCYSTNSDDHEQRHCQPHYYHPEDGYGNELIYVWSAGGWNNWEAVCKVDGTYYAIQVTKQSVPVAVLRVWLGSNQPSENHQSWIFADQNYDEKECKNPGPWPAPKP